MSIRLEFKQAVSLIQEQSMVIEIGSHEGDGVKYILKQRPKTIVYAIEPVPRLFKKLKKINKESWNLAIGDKMEIVGYKETKNSRQSMAGRTGSRVVEQLTLDDFMEINNIHRADLIRFDCYGAEYRIFHTDNDFLDVTDMIYITMHKRKVCPGVDVKQERKHITACLKDADFKLIASRGKGLDKHLFQLWKHR